MCDTPSRFEREKFRSLGFVISLAQKHKSFYYSHFSAPLSLLKSTRPFLENVARVSVCPTTFAWILNQLSCHSLELGLVPPVWISLLLLVSLAALSSSEFELHNSLLYRLVPISCGEVFHGFRVCCLSKLNKCRYIIGGSHIFLARTSV